MAKIVELAVVADADCVTLDALARLQLAARRVGLELRLCRAEPELRELARFTGLTGALRFEPQRQAEEGEEPLGIEKERQLDDPAA